MIALSRCHALKGAVAATAGTALAPVFAASPASAAAPATAGALEPVI